MFQKLLKFIFKISSGTLVLLNIIFRCYNKNNVYCGVFVNIATWNSVDLGIVVVVSVVFVGI